MRNLLFGSVAAAMLLVAAPALAAVDAFIWFDGAPGGSKTQPGAIEVTDWSIGNNVRDVETAAHGSGGGAGKVEYHDMHITVRTDAASPKLLNAANRGEHFKNVKLIMRKAGGTQQPYYTVQLSDVVISSIQHNGAGHGDQSPTESLTLNFTKIEWTYGQGGKTASDDWEARVKPASGGTTSNAWSH